MCLLFDIKEIIFCTSRPQYTHKIMSVFYFCLLVSQHSYLVWSLQRFVVERMYDVDVCAQQSSNAGVALNIPV